MSMLVAPREGRVSRNIVEVAGLKQNKVVAPREGRVSRNPDGASSYHEGIGRAPRGACE